MSQELLIDLSEICESSYKSVYDIEDQNKIDFANYMEERIMNKFEKLIETKLCLDETKDKRIKELEEIINLQNTEISNLNEKVLLLGNLKNQKESEKKTDDISYDKNDNFKISEVSLNVEDYNYHVKKLIETRKLAKIERMKKFGVMYCEDYANFTASLTDKDKETIINVNYKLLKANNDVLIILGLKKYSIKPFKSTPFIIVKQTSTFYHDVIIESRIIKRQYNIEELIEINKENILLFSEYEKLQKKLEQYKNNLFSYCAFNNINALNTLRTLSEKHRRYRANYDGIVKPTKISDEIASFLGKEKGTKMFRTCVTHGIYMYIKTHNLQDKDYGRKINPDNKLAALFNLKKTDEVTYFNLQYYLESHFAKNDRKISSGGLFKPTKISHELACFLGKEKGTEMARTDVTREINFYIRAHKLQDKENGRKINPDTKLSALLKLKKNDELTYFNLQRYLAPHFAKNDRKISV